MANYELVDADVLEDEYPDLLALARELHHRIVVGEDGKWRWMPNALICELHTDTPVCVRSLESHSREDAAPLPPSKAYSVSLQLMADRFARGRFSLREYMKYHMDIGYTLNGFHELFNERQVEAVINGDA